MNRNAIFSLAVVTLAALAVAGVAYSSPVASIGTTDAQNTLSVVGNAELSVQPDTVKVVVGTSVLDVSVQTATATAATNINRAIDAIKALGIPESQIETVSYSINAEYRWIKDEQVLVGYRVIHTLQVTYNGTDLGKTAGKIIDACVSNGLNYVGGVYFTVSDAVLSTLQSQALQLAVSNAQSKANTIASALNVNIVGVQQVSESYYSPQPLYNIRPTFAEGISTNILPGAVTVSASVSVTFIIQ